MHGQVPGTRPLNVLLLHDRQPRLAGTVDQHVAALANRSRHKVVGLKMLGDLPAGLDLAAFDAIVLHYTLVACHDAYVSPATRARLAAAPGVKAAFIQDEYRFVDRTVAALCAIGLDLLFTCVPEPEIEKVYPAERLPGVVKRNVLTGYVDESLLGRPVLALRDRPVDVGYRARKVPAWLGGFGQEKWAIGVRFGQDAPAHGLKVDLAYREEERLYGQAWIDFMTGCKATLGTESGASVFDFSGEVQRQVEAALLADPDLPFETLQERYFKHLEGLIRLNQISPRCFEAAALKTLMILYEGEYSGRLTAWRHYLPLNKDHSNMAEIAAALRDLPRCQAMVDCAYEEVALAPANSFRQHVAEVDAWLAEAWHDKRPSPAPGLADGALHRLQRPNFRQRRRNLQRWLYEHANLLLFRHLLGAMPAARRDRLQLVLHRGLKSLLTAVRPRV
ncbi:MAG: hypothetical protein FJX68_02335 [Alphaproteobacteria bacterium]|nr:hypothetical protein [Alphaproteobacteria bacterium]